jgi:hypothetical protein
VGAGTPSSRDEMGEGGGDFDSAERGRCADLLYVRGACGKLQIMAIVT